MTKKIVREELDKLKHEFGGLVKDGFTMNDEFMVDLLDKIEAKRAARKAEHEAKRVIAPAPPYIKNVVWNDDPKQGIPRRVDGKDISKRDFAMFAGESGEATYQMIMSAIRWKKSPMEPWRVICIHIMAWELSEAKQTFPTPSWLDLKAYGPKRFRTLKEVDDDHLFNNDYLVNVEPETVKKKRPTKKDLLDAKYAELMKLL